MKKLMVATALTLAAVGPALAYDLTTDPDAAMNQEQKLGPNVRSHRVGNLIVIHRARPYRHARWLDFYRW